MAWWSRKNKAWQQIKAATHSAKLLPRSTSLAGWASGDQMVYALNPAMLEIGQGGNSPVHGVGTIPAAGIGSLLLGFLIEGLPSFFKAWDLGEIPTWELVLVCIASIFGAALLIVPLSYLWLSFFAVTDPTIRFDHKRQKVWMWTGKGPIEMAWARLVPRVESSVATAYATVKTYRGQYAEVGADGNILVTNGIPHVFQVGQISAAEEGVRPAMEYVRLYMDAGPHAVRPPEKFLSHRTPWYAMVNFIGMADEWVRWRENRDKPDVAPAPWVRTVGFVLLFPLFFPLQFTNWLALTVAPRPKWPKELDAMHAADLAQAQQSETQRRQQDLTADRASEAQVPRRKPVIRVNGEIVSGADTGSQ